MGDGFDGGGGVEIDKTNLDLDPNMIKWFVDSGFEGAEQLYDAQILSGFRDGTRRIRSREGRNIDKVILGFNEFMASKGKSQEEYIKMKRQVPGREQTILVPNQNNEETIL